MSDRYTLTRRRFIETAGVTAAGLITAGKSYSADEKRHTAQIVTHDH